MDTHLRSIVVLRSILAAIAGLVAGFLTAPHLGLAAALLAGWSTFAVIVTVWVALVIWPMDAAATRLHAIAEDPGRSVARLVALIGSVASLGAVGVVLIQTDALPEYKTYLLATIALVSVVSSWGLIQMDYTLRVARIYYAEPAGGIDFNTRDDPSYSDFLYFALGVGMGYQVGDTTVSTNQIRRLVVGQALLAYMFGAVIIGTVVNLVLDLG